METLQDILLKRKEQTLCKSERAEIIKQIYEIYTSPYERILRKKENWKRYITYLKANKIKHDIKVLKKYKSSKTFIKEHPVKTIAYFIGHIPTKDLYFMKGQMFDNLNRGKSASAYLLGSIKIK